MVILLVAVSACQEGRQNYLVNGIGTELSGPNLAGAESLQNRYFGYLCRQAYPNYQAGTTCNVGDWNLIAYQGMNDIDRRCDSYLQWLDNRKRSRGPWVSQIGDTAAATAAILPAVGASTKAITIVAQAFQLVTKSVENYHSRLLLEVESSTVNSIVLQARHNFRKYLIEQNSRATNKPEAEYILRSYTRLCLPFAIEAKVNDYSTLGSLGQAPEAAGTHADMPVVKAIAPQQDFGTGERIRRGIKTPPGFEKVFVNPSKYEQQDLVLLQNALCLQGQGVGSIGSKTKAAIQIFEDTVLKSADFGDVRQPNKNGLIDDFELSFITNFGSCNAGSYRNMFERVNYDILSPDKAANARRDLIRLLNARLGTNVGEGLGFGDAGVRDLFERARTVYGASDYGGFASQQMTSELSNLLVDGPPPNG